MKAKVIRENRNPILKRKEILVELTHDESGTPERLAARRFLASQLEERIENLYLTKVEGKTGADKSLCHVEVYETKELAEETLPKHILRRNLPPEERQAKKTQPESPKREAVKEKVPEKAKAPEAERQKK